MAFNPLNNPLPGSGPNPAPNIQSYLDQWEQLNDSARHLHEKLLDQVNAIKSAREETKNIYDLQDQLNELLSRNKNIESEKNDLSRKATGEAKRLITAIQEGFEARRDQGEELSKFQ